MDNTGKVLQHRVRGGRTDLGARAIFGASAVERIRISPVLKAAVFDRNKVSRRNGRNSFDDSTRLVDGPEGQKTEKSIGIEFPRDQPRLQEGSHFGSEEKMSCRAVVVEGLDAHGIAHKQQTIAVGIPERESKHPTQFGKTALAPDTVPGEDHFRVGMALEAVARRFEFRAEFAKVIDFAVEHNLIAGGRIAHGLVAERREGVSKTELTPGTCFNNGCAGIVRATVSEGQRGTIKNVLRDATICRQNAEDSTHGFEPLIECPTKA